MKRNYFLLAFMLLLTSLSFAQIPTNGLVGYYPFNANANDLSGNNNNGTVHSATLTTDRFGNANSAFLFNGSSDYISASNAPLLNPPFTISAWISVGTVTIPANEPIVSLGELGSNSLKKMYFSPAYNNSNGQPSIGTAGANDITSTSLVVNTGTWKHVVATVTSYSTNGVIYYVDGVAYSQNTTGGTNVPFPLNNSGFTIGYHTGGGPARYFHGKIDDIGIWSRVLTQQEVTQIYNTGSCLHYDTIHSYDTTHLSVYDTTHIMVYDTIHTFISVEDTLTIQVNLTGINPPNNINLVTVYPNPANNHLVVNNGNLAAMSGYSIKITDVLGQVVFNQAITQQQFYIDITNWGGSGTYILYVLDGQQSVKSIKHIVLY